MNQISPVPKSITLSPISYRTPAIPVLTTPSHTRFRSSNSVFAPVHLLRYTETTTGNGQPAPKPERKEQHHVNKRTHPDTTVLTQRFDSTSFKKKYEELYRAFTKQTTSKRFTIS